MHAANAAAIVYRSEKETIFVMRRVCPKWYLQIMRRQSTICGAGGVNSKRIGGDLKMTVGEIIEMDIITDGTEVVIRDSESNFLAKGVWYCDRILKYLKHKVQSFTWEVGKNNVIINLKEDGK